MKKILLSIIVIISLSLVPFAHAQTHTQSISFDDGVGPGNAGTYNSTDSFSVDLYLTYSGYNSYGFDLWLETTAAAAPFISLTGFTYGTTFYQGHFIHTPLAFTSDQGTGFYTTPNPSNFGSRVPPFETSAVPPGTYFVGDLTVSLSGLAPGVYVLRTDATSPHVSEVADTDFMDNNIPISEYTITVVPEPGTVSFIGFGAIGLAATLYRKKRRTTS